MYLIALLFITVVCIGIGQFMLYLFKVRTIAAYRPLLVLITGLLTTVSLYSIVITQGKTVQLGFLIVGMIAWAALHQENYLLANRDNLKLFYKEDLKQYALFGGIILLWTGYFYTVFQCYTYGQAGYLSLIYEDVFYYSMLGECISASGQENVLGNSLRLDANFHGMVSYHYFELYLGQLLADIFSLNALKTHIYLTNAFGVGLISYASFVFSKELLGVKVSKWLLVGSLLSVFYSGIKLPIPMREAGHYIMPLLELNTMKFAFLFLFFLIGTYMALIGNRLFLLPFLLLPILNYILLPPLLFVLPTMALGACFYYYKNKTKPKLFVIYGIGSLFLLLFLIGIYQVWGMPKEYAFVTIQPWLLLTQVLEHWRTSLGIIVGTHLYVGIDYIPYIVLSGLFWYCWGQRVAIRKIPIQLAIIPLLFFAGPFSWAILLFVTHESFQIHAILTGFVGNVAIIFSTVLVYKSLQKNQKWYLLAQVPLLVYLMYFTLYHNNRTYSRERSGVIPLEAINEILPFIPNQNAKIATLDTRERRHEIYPYGAWLTYFKQQVILTSISPVLLSDKFDYQPQVVDNVGKVSRISTPFYRYVQQNVHVNKDIKTIQLSFLKHYQVDYVLVEPTYVDSTGILKSLKLKTEGVAGRLYAVE